MCSSDLTQAGGGAEAPAEAHRSDFAGSTAGGVSAELSLFPNPARSELTVAGLSGGEALRVYDLRGRELRFTLAPRHAERVRLGLDGLPAGTYVLRVGNRRARRFTKH